MKKAQHYGYGHGRKFKNRKIYSPLINNKLVFENSIFTRYTSIQLLLFPYFNRCIVGSADNITII